MPSRRLSGRVTHPSRLKLLVARAMMRAHKLTKCLLTAMPALTLNLQTVDGASGPSRARAQNAWKEVVMFTTPELHTVHQRVVDANSRLLRTGELAASVRLRLMIDLRQALRDLCVATHAWDPDLEMSHQADMAALGGLANA
jgi:hypothetical protein